MVDNFSLIDEFITPQLKTDTDAFFLCQVIRRGKDYPNLPASNHTFKDYYISKISPLEGYKDEIIRMCDAFGARAYIYLGIRSYRRVCEYAMSDLLHQMAEGDLKKPYRVFSRAASKHPETKMWLWDYDYDVIGKERLDEVKACIDENVANKNRGSNIIMEIPTNNGCHLITRKFNRLRMDDRFPEVELKKHGMTLLYMPDIVNQC